MSISIFVIIVSAIFLFLANFSPKMPMNQKLSFQIEIS